MHEPCGRDAPLYVQLTHDNNNPHQQGGKKPPCFFLKVQTKQGLAKKMNATGRRHSEEAWHARRSPRHLAHPLPEYQILIGFERKETP